MRFSAGEIPRRATTIGLALLLLAGLVFLWIETAKFARPLVKGAPSAAFFPRLVIAFLIVTVGALLVREIRTGAERWIEFPFLGVLLAVVVSAVYIALVPYLGFEIPTVTFVAGQLMLTYRPAVSIVAGLVTMLAFWLVFVILLQIDIPLLLLPKYLT